MTLMLRVNWQYYFSTLFCWGNLWSIISIKAKLKEFINFCGSLWCQQPLYLPLSLSIQAVSWSPSNRHAIVVKLLWLLYIFLSGCKHHFADPWHICHKVIITWINKLDVQSEGIIYICTNQSVIYYKFQYNSVKCLYNIKLMMMGTIQTTVW